MKRGMLTVIVPRYEWLTFSTDSPLEGVKFIWLGLDIAASLPLLNIMLYQYYCFVMCYFSFYFAVI